MGRGRVEGLGLGSRVWGCTLGAVPFPKYRSESAESRLRLQHEYILAVAAFQEWHQLLVQHGQRP